MSCLREPTFYGFWSILGGMLGRKTEPKWNQNRSPKDIENLMGILEASWSDLERQVGLQGGRAERPGSRGGRFGGVL